MTILDLVALKHKQNKEQPKPQQLHLPVPEQGYDKHEEEDRQTYYIELDQN